MNQEEQIGDIKVKVEASDKVKLEGGFEDAGGIISKTKSKVVEVSVTAFMKTVESVALGFENKMNELQSKTSFSEASIEFGLATDGKGNIYIFQVGSEVNLKVTLTWKPNSSGARQEE